MWSLYAGIVNDMNEIQIAIEATKLAIIDLILTDHKDLADMVEHLPEDVIRSYMSSETLGNDTQQWEG